uniref:Uncharacterized protein n=1 Tax=Anguilla anguilla TaxID=7936 RepID=A0A0E9TUK4_ANGAN
MIAFNIYILKVIYYFCLLPSNIRIAFYFCSSNSAYRKYPV